MTLLLTALLAPAMARPTSAEAHQSAAELSTDYAALDDDRSDLRALDALIDDWNAARRRGSRGAELAADRALKTWLKQEIAESRRELTLAQSELAASQRELNQTCSSHRSAARQDDARDLADDRRDLDRAQSELARLQRIASSLNAMQARFESGRASHSDYSVKRGLMADLRSIAAAEMGSNYAELDEDRGEHREDMRG